MSMEVLFSQIMRRGLFLICSRPESVYELASREGSTRPRRAPAHQGTSRE